MRANTNTPKTNAKAAPKTNAKAAPKTNAKAAPKTNAKAAPKDDPRRVDTSKDMLYLYDEPKQLMVGSDCCVLEIAEFVKLVLYDGGDSYDYGYLNIHGVLINVRVIPTNDHYFLSYPSYYNDNTGEYKDNVIVFNKHLKDAIATALECFYTR